MIFFKLLSGSALIILLTASLICAQNSGNYVMTIVNQGLSCDINNLNNLTTPPIHKLKVCI